MSATRDKSLKVGFVYSNLYEMYKRVKNTPVNDESPLVLDKATGLPSKSPSLPLTGLTKGAIIKPKTLAEAQTTMDAAPTVSRFTPPEFIGKRVEHAPLYVAKPEVLKHAQSHAPAQHAVESLKESLNRLSDLHTRLKFMLKEIEDLSKE